MPVVRVKRKEKMLYTGIMAILLFCVLFLFLFFLSRSITRLLSHLLIEIFHSHTVAIHVLSFLFLPGVILHELSHLLLANLLLVPTGEVEFFPEIHGSQVKMGSVAIARTDPLRRFLIGVAPVIGGLGMMLLLSSFLTGAVFSWQSALLLYGIFQIVNTMFSSSKDMEGALGFAIGALLLLLALQLLGVPVWVGLVAAFQSSVASDFFTRLNFFLVIAMGLNIFLVLLFEGLSRLNAK